MPRKKVSLVQSGAEYDAPLPVVQGGVNSSLPSAGQADPKNQPGVMSPEDVKTALRMLAQSAETYCDQELAPDRVEAIKRYKGEKYGNEQEGRSQIVMTTVRDTVLATEPQLLRTAFGPEPAVAFVPLREELVDQAEQQSDFASYIYRESPDALLNTKAVINDGLVCRTGFAKVWWEPAKGSTTTDQKNLTELQVKALVEDPSCTYRITRHPSDENPTYDCTVTHQEKGEVRWGALPPEEVIWNRDARSWESAVFLAHRQDRTVGECVADGFRYEDVIPYAKATDRITWGQDRLARLPDATIDNPIGDDTPDPSLWRVPFYEAYVRLDEDGDRVTELRRYHLVGPYVPIKRVNDDSPYLGQSVESADIYGWCPFPIPHTPVGQSVFDLAGDMQRVKTALVRANLDSLGLALAGRIAYRKGMVSLKDLLNPEVGALIGTEGDPNQSLREFGHSYVGKDAFPMMAWVEDETERRTGKTKESQGLNADALQSSTKQGVMATLSAAAARDELLARLFAENILRPVFRAIYRLTKQYQDIPRVMRMRGKFVTVDPRTWDDNCEVKVNLGLGMGLAQERLERYMAIYQEQKALMLAGGMNNPLTDFAKMSRTLHKAIAVSGDPNSEEFFNLVSEQDVQQMRAMAAQQPPKEDPAQQAVLMQAQAQMLQAQVAQGRLQLDQQKAVAEAELEREKLALDYAIKQEEMRQKFALETQEMELRYQTNVREQDLNAFIRGREKQADILEQQEDSQRKMAADLYKTDVQAQTATQTAALKAQADIVKAEKSQAQRPVSD